MHYIAWTYLSRNPQRSYNPEGYNPQESCIEDVEFMTLEAPPQLGEVRVYQGIEWKVIGRYEYEPIEISKERFWVICTTDGTCGLEHRADWHTPDPIYLLVPFPVEQMPEELLEQLGESMLMHPIFPQPGEPIYQELPQVIVKSTRLFKPIEKSKAGYERVAVCLCYADEATAIAAA